MYVLMCFAVGYEIFWRVRNIDAIKSCYVIFKLKLKIVERSCSMLASNAWRALFHSSVDSYGLQTSFNNYIY
jgi:hypothetical protein